VESGFRNRPKVGFPDCRNLISSLKVNLPHLLTKSAERLPPFLRGLSLSEFSDLRVDRFCYNQDNVRSAELFGPKGISALRVVSEDMKSAWTPNMA
jgi:hypothetical protein